MVLKYLTNTTDASNVFQVKNAQGYINIHSFDINAYNASNDSPSLFLLNTVSNGGVYCLNLGIGVICWCQSVKRWRWQV